MQKINAIKVLDVVALMEELSTAGLRRGEVGTVVEQWEDRAFEVEFSNDSGEPYAFAAVSGEKLLKLYFRKGKAD